MFYVDLDGMKIINDTYGHVQGDLALKGAAAVLRGTFRESDIVARLGGDEFAALSFAATEQSAAGLQARLLWRLDDFNAERQLPYQLSLSYGYTRFVPEEPATLEELTARADVDLYDRKRAKNTTAPTSREGRLGGGGRD